MRAWHRAGAERHRLCGCTVLDERMDGTVHIAIAASDPFGGENQASDYVDFVGRGKIEVIRK